MRTVTYGAACSLDGFIAAADGGLDWLHFSPDVQNVMAEYWATIDTVLYGRKTWEIAAALGGGGSAGPSMAGITTYIFSRTLRDVPAGTRLVAADAGDFVRQLKGQRGKGICVMSGGDFACSLFKAGVIDEVRINIHPVLLGSGVPLFRDAARRVVLELTDSRVIDGGCLLPRYRVRD
jgi:dihydrofolate reductase